MKITKLTTLCLTRLHERERQWITARYRTVKADCAIVVIETDDGQTGIGEASAYGWPNQIAGWVEWLSPLLVGKDPTDPSIALRPNGRGRAYDCAAAGYRLRAVGFARQDCGQARQRTARRPG